MDGLRRHALLSWHRPVLALQKDDAHFALDVPVGLWSAEGMRSRARTVLVTLLALAMAFALALVFRGWRTFPSSVGTKQAAAPAASATPARTQRLPRGRRPAPGLVELRGRVAAAGDGAPIRDADVEIETGGKAVASVETDEAGDFVAFVPTGEVYVRASARGFLTQGTAATAPDAAVTLRLVRGATIAGRIVRADDGTPVPGASVTAALETAEPPALADGDGKFRLVGLRAGPHRPAARALGLLGQAAEEISVNLGEAREGVVIAMRPAASLRVHLLVARTGLPCPSGGVVLTSSGSGMVNASVDGNGQVLFPALLPGTYFAMPTCAGSNGGLAPQPLEIADAPVEVTYRVPVHPVLRGVVVEEDGAPTTRPDLRVELRRAAASDQDAIEKGLVHDGHFSIRFDRAPVPEGEYIVQVVDWAGVVSVAPERVALAEGVALRDMHLVVAPRLHLEGLVVDEQGTPLLRTNVRAAQEGYGATVEHTSELDGTFLVNGLRPGRVRLDVLLGLGAERVEDSLQVASGDVEPTVPRASPVKLVVKAGRIDGQVISLDGTQRYLVYALASDPDASDLPGRAFYAQHSTSTNGQFLVHVPPTGTYSLFVQSRYGESVDGVLARPGDHVALRVRPSARLRGTVRNAPRSFTVRASPREETFTDTNGKWELSGVQAGDVEVQVFAGDQNAEGTVHVEPGATSTIDMTLTPGPSRTSDEDEP